MAKDSDRLADSFQIEESAGAFSRLLAEEDEFDRRALWRLGSWAAVSVGSVIVAILASQSSIGMRRELSASADLVRQAQQFQLAAKDNLGETRRLASAVETLNGDRDRLYSRVAVLEQGLDSVTGAIARQNSTASPALHPVASPAQAGIPPVPAAPATSAPVASSSAAPAPPAAPTTASAEPAAAAAVEAPPAAAKPTTAAAAPAPAPAATPVATTARAATDKPAPKPAGADPASAQASIPAPPPPAPPQPVALLVAPKSMTAPHGAAAAKLIEPAPPPKALTSAPIPEVTATLSKTPEKTPEQDVVSEAPSAVPELAVRRTEFGLDVGGANSIPGLRALWRGLLKSKANAALAALRPIIVIKENGNGLGMQLRLVAGPISDAAAAAKICATLTVSDRSCTTAVFEGQRLAVEPEEQAKADTRPAAETAAAPAEAARSAPKPSFHKRYYISRQAPKEEAPKPAEQPSTLSQFFGRH